ncbi:hypothetical protein HPT29_028390 (plasmid) [Microvirga terrae]|uniref:Uncharacterized protein n=1 Tax=Microvirga terrae TaxID=2740529 RepID=A0ABY5S0S8_9HYPH|nr:hypothetical protein [Microvirga terrae]UVF22873.1 hypothetical protein HPT29_028390 [Microvirga terrae]
MAHVWAVCTLLPEQGEQAWELIGIYDSLEAALEACTDDQTTAVRFELNKSYRGIHDLEVITPRQLAQPTDDTDEL